MEKITLPAGVSRVDKNSNYTAKEGDTIWVTDKQASEIKSRTTAPGRKPIPSLVTSVGTRDGRQCPQCNRVWQVWTTECHNCGVETIKV